MNRPADEPSANALEPELWLEAHGDALFRYAYFRLRDAPLAEDLVQETLLAALQARDRFAGRSSVRTWLTAILKNKLVDHLRKHGREQSLDALTGPDGAPDQVMEALFVADGHWHSPPAAWANPQASLEQREFWRIFVDCLEALPRRQAEAFALCELDGLAGGEAGKVLGVSPSNLWVLLHRARLRLRRCLELTWFNPKTEGQS